jgi:hypothetical protein
MVRGGYDMFDSTITLDADDDIEPTPAMAPRLNSRVNSHAVAGVSRLRVKMLRKEGRREAAARYSEHADWHEFRARLLGLEKRTLAEFMRAKSEAAA